MIRLLRKTAMHPEPHIVIRDAQPSEFAAVHALTVSAYEQYAAALSQPWWERYQQVIANTFATPDPVCRIVAARANDLLGAVLYFPASPLAERALPMIRLLAVPPAGRGQGTGRLLMEECLRRAREAGAPAITLHTMEVMAVARRMYEGMGFVRAPETDFSSTPELLVMGYRLDLTPQR